MVARLLAGLLLLGVHRAHARTEGYAVDRILFTNAVQPPEINSFHLRTFSRNLEYRYDVPEVLELGISKVLPNGQNRTLRPHGIVVLEGAFVDTIFWTDAGAGAIFSLRFDASPMQLVLRGLRAPEPLLLDATRVTDFEGPWLYWGDSEANAVQRCQLSFGIGGVEPNCTRGAEDVVTGVRHVAGLALAPRAPNPELGSQHDVLYWADGVEMKIYSASLDSDTGVVNPASLEEVVGCAPPRAPRRERHRRCRCRRCRRCRRR